MTKLYKFQAKCLKDLNDKKHICCIGTGCGKSVVALRWAKDTGKRKVLVVTTPSKRDSGDFVRDAVEWCGNPWVKSLLTFEVIGWAGLSKWANSQKNFSDWAIIFDEVAYAKHGVQSKRGKAFLRIASQTDCWTGYTATPGDKWIDFQAYAIATKLVRNLTQFRGKFCNIQTYKGFPEIVGYHDTDVLSEWWDSISTRPDTSVLLSELPKDIHHTVEFKIPAFYRDTLKTRITPEGDMLDTTMGLCMWARKACATDKRRQQWLKDFMENNPDNIVFFTNFIDEAKMVASIHKKIYPNAKAWKIDGRNHDIPTKDTIGPHDIVVANYQSGSEGLNLQFIPYAVFVSPNYSYSVSVQARGRIRRIGSTNEIVHYYYLKCPETIENAIYKCLHSKSDFSETTWEAQL